ncbi:MAG: hypothetical protein PF541_10885 [Prolixibacteraceae bacterium]|jgi:hypothetical protein|nr:hypothetical protein [Prolixibacteraceae bacterium]
MRNLITIALILFFSSITTLSKGQTFPPNVSFNNSVHKDLSLSNVPLNNDLLYLGDNDKIYTMNLSSPSSISLVTDIPGNDFYTGDFDNSGMLFYIDGFESNSHLYSIDITTGQINVIGTLNGSDIAPFGTAVGMSYYNGIMYGIFSISPNDVSASAVFTIDLSNGLCTRISTSTFPGFYVGLAIDQNGIFYGLDAESGQTGKLYSIDPNTGTRNLIGDTGLNTWTICGLDFDLLKNKLYLSDINEGGIYTLDLNTANPTFIAPHFAFLAAVNATSSTVPINYRYTIMIFILIAGALIARKFVF